MALANRSTASNSDATTAGQTLNIPVGSGNNRVVVAFFTQFRTPVTVGSGTLNGTAGTLIATVDSPDGTRRSTAWIWLDAALPTSSGDYTVTYTGAGSDIAIHAIHYSGAAQDSTPTYASTSANSGASGISLSPTLTSGAVVFGATHSTNLTITGSQTAILANGNSGNTTHSSSYNETNNAITYSSTTQGNAAIAVAIEAAAAGGLTITSVTPSSFDSGIAGIVIAGSGFGASQGSSTVDIGGQAQTVTAWGDTSITITSARGSNSMGAGQLKVTIR